MWSPEWYYRIHIIYWLIFFIGLGLVWLDTCKITTSGITGINTTVVLHCWSLTFISYICFLGINWHCILFVLISRRCLEKVKVDKCKNGIFQKMVMRDILLFHDTIINIFINCICCRPSDANGVCHPRYCAPDKLGTVFACEENACLQQNSSQQRVTQRICLSEWPVSCLNGYQSRDF